MPDEIRGKWTKENSKWIENYIEEVKELVNNNMEKIEILQK